MRDECDGTECENPECQPKPDRSNDRLNAMERTQIIEVIKYVRQAKNSLVIAALALDQMDKFDKSVSAIKEVVGDLICTEKLLDEAVRI